jgi:hypothetical protein
MDGFEFAKDRARELRQTFDCSGLVRIIYSRAPFTAPFEVLAGEPIDEVIARLLGDDR